MTKKMGRPRFPAGEVRGGVLMLRVRAEERRAIMRAAKLAGEPYSVWMREVVLRAARRTRSR